MPTPVNVARQCLTEEAARALDEAVAVARRRSHAQTTSLHAVSALLALPSSTLRDACARARGGAYPSRLQFRALDLCVGVSLDRLPSTKSLEDPPISNSLMAAIKRSQANQRRHPDNYHLQQLHGGGNNPTAAVLKVELKYFILSILDDPIVSRVFGEAGFRSCDIKLALLRPPVTPIASRFPRTRCPPIFLCNLTDSDPCSSRGGFNLPFSGSEDDIDDNCRRIKEVMVQEKGKNPLLVGVCAQDALRSFCESYQMKKAGFLPQNLTGTSVISIEKEISEYAGGGSEESIGMKLEQVVESCNEAGVVLNIGDIKWSLDDGVSTEAVSCLVSKLSTLLELHQGKFWLVGAAATYEMYSNFLAKFPGVEKNWDLHLLPISSFKSSFERSYSKSSFMGSFVPFGGFFTTPSDFKNPLSSSNEFTPLCRLCNDKYEQEVASVRNEGTSPSVADQYSGNLPSWLRMTPLDKNKGADNEKIEDDGTMSNCKVLGLQKKWSDICHRLHKNQPFTSLDMPQTTPQLSVVDASRFSNLCHGMPMSLHERMRMPVASESQNVDFRSRLEIKVPNDRLIGKESCWSGHYSRPNLSPPSDLTSSSGPSVATDLKLGTDYASTSREPKSSKLLDHEERLLNVSGSISAEVDANSDNSSPQLAQSSPCSGLTSSERYHPRDYKLIATALAGKVGWQDEAICAVSEALSRRRTGYAKGATWLTFLGPDRIGKRRLAASLADILYGSREQLISVDLRSESKVSQSNSIFECQELNGYDTKFRGKTVADYIAGELSRKPHSVIFLENINKADILVQTSLSQCIRTGKFPDSHGREIRISDAVFVTTSSISNGDRDVSRGKKAATFSEESILGAKSWQMQILVSYDSVDASRSSRNMNVRVTRGKETSNAASVKRKLVDISDSIEQEKAQRGHKALRSSLDLNLPVEETEEDVDCHDYDSDSISENTEAWLEQFLDQAHQKIAFKPYDFDAFADKIVNLVSIQLAKQVGSSHVMLEIDQEVMAQILAAAWLSERANSLDEWIDKVLIRGVGEARKKYCPSSRCVLKLVACEGVPLVEQASGLCLPANINLG